MYAVALGSSGRPRGEPERLTTGLECLSISLSGDGRRIAYAVYSGRSNIWSLPIPEGDPVTAEAAVRDLLAELRRKLSAAFGNDDAVTQLIRTSTGHGYEIALPPLTVSIEP